MFRASPPPQPLLANGRTRGSQCSRRLLMIGGETPETCWATYKRQVINLWNCCILLVDLFEQIISVRRRRSRILRREGRRKGNEINNPTESTQMGQTKHYNLNRKPQAQCLYTMQHSGKFLCGLSTDSGTAITFGTQLRRWRIRCKQFLRSLVWLNIKATCSYFFVTFSKKKCVSALFVTLVLPMAELMVSLPVWR